MVLKKKTLAALIIGLFLVTALVISFALLSILNPYEAELQNEINITDDNISNINKIEESQEVESNQIISKKEVKYTNEKFIVENIRISCNIYSTDFDNDGIDDGIYYYIRLSNSTTKVIPAEGYFTTEFFYTISAREDREKGISIDYIQKQNVKGEDRMNYFNSEKGYFIAIKWDDLKSELNHIKSGSLSNNIILKTTFITKEGASVTDEAGEFENHFCTISERYLETI